MKIQINGTSIPGCYEIFLPVQTDERGNFVKIFHQEVFRDRQLDTHFPEEYYSISHHGVLRGMHFQIPPKDYVKLVCCLAGEIFDAVVDLRVGSPSFGQFATFELSGDKGNILYIPQGLAHGFYVMNEKAIVLYKVSSVYSPEHDTGILWNSIGIPWPDENPILSQRDSTFQTLAEFESPFHYLEKA